MVACQFRERGPVPCQASAWAARCLAGRPVCDELVVGRACTSLITAKLAPQKPWILELSPRLSVSVFIMPPPGYPVTNSRLRYRPFALLDVKIISGGRTPLRPSRDSWRGSRRKIEIRAVTPSPHNTSLEKKRRAWRVAGSRPAPVIRARPLVSAAAAALIVVVPFSR